MTTKSTLFNALLAYTLFFIDICEASRLDITSKITASKHIDSNEYTGVKTTVQSDKEQKLLSLYDGFHGASIIGLLPPHTDANRQQIHNQHDTFENQQRNQKGSDKSKLFDAPITKDEGRSIVDAFDHASIVGLPMPIIQQRYPSMFRTLMDDSTHPLKNSIESRTNQLEEQANKYDAMASKHTLKSQASTNTATQSRRNASPMDAFDQASMIAFYDSSSSHVSAGFRSTSTTSTVLRHRRLPALNKKSLTIDPVTGASRRYVRKLNHSSNTTQNMNTISTISRFWFCVAGVIIIASVLVTIATTESASCLPTKKQTKNDTTTKDYVAEVLDLEVIPGKEIRNESSIKSMRSAETVVKIHSGLENMALHVIREEEDEASEAKIKPDPSVPISKLFSLILDVIHEFETKKTHQDEPETSETSRGSSSIFFEHEDDIDKFPARLTQTYIQEDAGIPAWIEFQRCDEDDEEQPDRISSLGTDRLTCGHMRLEV